MKGQSKQPQACTRARRASWPEGATAGLLLVALLCLGIATAVYQIAGPREVFADEIAAR